MEYIHIKWLSEMASDLPQEDIMRGAHNGTDIFY